MKNPSLPPQQEGYPNRPFGSLLRDAEILKRPHSGGLYLEPLTRRGFSPARRAPPVPRSGSPARARLRGSPRVPRRTTVPRATAPSPERLPLPPTLQVDR